MINLFASLAGLVTMAVICPTVTLREGRQVLSAGWATFLVIFEMAPAIFLAALPYRKNVRQPSDRPGKHR